IGIFTDVNVNDKIEWIPTWYGERITEWASWTSSLNVDLISYYKFDGIGTVNAEDNVSSFNFTLAGNPPHQAGIINNSQLFTGGDNGDTGAIGWKLLNNFTVTGWVKFTDPSSRQDFYGMRKDANEFFQLNIGDGGSSFRINVNDGATSGDFNCGTIVGANQWTFFAIKFNGTVNLYHNGTFCSTGASGGKLQLSTATFDIGHSISGVNAMTGNLDEIGVWNRTLS
ncbi:unnamed protein product, partial [marine sediment metagenome]